MTEFSKIIQEKLVEILEDLQGNRDVISYEIKPENFKGADFLSLGVEIMKNQFIALSVFKSKIFSDSCRMVEEIGKRRRKSEFSLLVGMECPSFTLRMCIENEVLKTIGGLNAENSFWYDTIDIIRRGHKRILKIKPSSEKENKHKRIDFWIYYVRFWVPIQIKSYLAGQEKHKNSLQGKKVPSLFYKRYMFSRHELIRKFDRICLSYISYGRRRRKVEHI